MSLADQLALAFHPAMALAHILRAAERQNPLHIVQVRRIPARARLSNDIDRVVRGQVEPPDIQPETMVTEGRGEAAGADDGAVLEDEYRHGAAS